MNDLKKYNEYLFHEFGFDDEYTESDISETFPFELILIDTVDVAEAEAKIFEFVENETDYFLVDGNSLTFYEKSGLNFEQFMWQLVGSSWIGAQNPIDLDTSMLGDESVPSIPDRIREIGKNWSKYNGERAMRIIEGLYLQNTRQYLALIENLNDKSVSIIGENINLRKIPFENLSPWRRLSIGIGKLVASQKIG